MKHYQMMVVHEDNERPVEVSVIKKPLLEQKSYVIVKNHVRELSNTVSEKQTINIAHNSEKSGVKNKSRKFDKLNKTEVIPTISHGNKLIAKNSKEIDPNDLEELKTVYMKCKEVMKRIESKYGHLLDLDNEPLHSKKRTKQNWDETSDEECRCQFNKKIVFDDDGRQVAVDNITENHICVKRIKPENKNINIVVEEQDNIVLPDSLKELGAMLHDPDIENTLRNKVLDKIRSIKLEYVNEIKFNKHILIEKLKSNPDEVLDFKGTNLSKIPGYS